MRVSSPRTTPEFYTWTFAGAPIRIDLALLVVERLRREALRSPDAESGGILLGDPPSDSHVAVRITDFQPFPLRGRSRCVLSEAEIEEFAQTVAELRQSGPPVAVGYYRSHLRGGNIRLDQPDLELIRASLNRPADVILVMRPDPRGEVTAGFFFWDEGRVQSDFSFLEFPLHADELRQQSDVGRRPASGGRRARMRLVWAAIALGLLVIAALVGLRAKRPVPAQGTGPASPVTPLARLGLRCEVSGSKAKIAWDKFAPALATARVGLLSINDGKVERSMSLTAEELRAGGIPYSPVSATVLLRLEVFDANGGVAREVVAAALPARGPPVIPAAPKDEPEVSGVASRQRQPARSFTPPTTQAAAPDAAVPVPEPPLLPAASGPIGEITGLMPAPQVPGRPPEPQPPAAPIVKPSTAETPPVSQADQYTPPIAVAQVRPVLPAAARSMLSREMQVQVRVHVDENGRVVGAEPGTIDQPLDRLLGAFAAHAARQWRFRPARRNSQAVPGDVVLNFTFAPGR